MSIIRIPSSVTAADDTRSETTRPASGASRPGTVSRNRSSTTPALFAPLLPEADHRHGLPRSGSTRPPIRATHALHAFLTEGQRNSLASGDHGALERENDAAVEEAITRSKLDYVYRSLGCDSQTASPASSRAPGPSIAESAMPESAPISTNAHTVRQPSALTPTRDDLERSGQAPNNAKLRTFLDDRGFKLIPSRTEGYNCSIYSIVQQLRPALSRDRLDAEVSAIRTDYDRASRDACRNDPSREGDRKKMLYFDARRNGAAPLLLDIINKRYGCNVEVGLVMAGPDAHPLTHCGTVRSSPEVSDDAITHRIVICDLLGHYEAIGMK